MSQTPATDPALVADLRQLIDRKPEQTIRADLQALRQSGQPCDGTEEK